MSMSMLHFYAHGSEYFESNRSEYFEADFSELKRIFLYEYS
jgi:hypothetical protein